MRNLRFIVIMAVFSLLPVLFGTASPPPQTEDRGTEQNRKEMRHYNEAFYKQLPQGRYQEAEGRGAEHNRMGMQHYNEAFYRQLPQGRHQEAERFFDLAAIEFQNAIAASPKDAEAHRNLARLYYVRKQFPQAAHAYTSLTILEPKNIDTYAQLALCYTQLNQFDEAIQELEIAKTKTDNPEVIGKLDEYIRKIMDHRQD